MGIQLVEDDDMWAAAEIVDAAYISTPAAIGVVVHHYHICYIVRMEGTSMWVLPYMKRRELVGKYVPPFKLAALPPPCVNVVNPCLLSAVMSPRRRSD